MSHLACAYDQGSQYNNTQLEKLLHIKKLFPDAKFSIANSAAIFLGTEYHQDVIRIGAGLYGIGANHNNNIKLHNVVKLISRIVQIRKCNIGDKIGYNNQYIMKKNGRIATIPIGYADGYLGLLSNKGIVNIQGFKAPIVSCISMDLITVDITDIPENLTHLNSEVEVIGDNVTIDQIAKLSGISAYELLTSLGTRYKREYIHDHNLINNNLVTEQLPNIAKSNKRSLIDG